MSTFVALSILVIGIWFYSHLSYRKRSKGCSLPPSPKKSWIPFVGNGLEVLFYPQPFPVLAQKMAAQFKDQDIFCLDVFGTPLVFLNSTKAVKELFESRGQIYSSRAPMPLLREVVSRSQNLSFEPYNDMWRLARRAGHRELNVTSVKQYSVASEREAYVLIQGLLKHSHKDLEMLSFRFAGASAFSSFYDISVNSYHDEQVEESVRLFGEKVALLSPGASFYDSLPALIRPIIPEFLMPSLKRARQLRDAGEAIDRRLANSVQTRLERGEDTSSFHAALLQRANEGKQDLTEFQRNTLSGVLVAASVDTSQAAIHTLILALICFPEAQKAAQAAVDKVVGRDRLPTFADIPNLPHVRALALEALRWRGVSRIASPHCLDKDDWYNGYFLPKGSTVVHNAYVIERDSREYPEPELMKPERFLNDDGSFNEQTPIQSFGMGRRVCLGANMAINTLQVATACLLWAFDFSKARDADGKIMEPNLAHDAFIWNGIVARVNDFPFECKARDGQVKELVQAVVN